MITLESMSAIVGFINASETPLMIIDRHSRILFAAASVCKLLGGGPSDIIGQNLNIFIDQSQSHPHRTELQRVAEGESKQKISISGWVTAKTLSGERVRVNVQKRMRYRVGQTRYYSAEITK